MRKIESSAKTNDSVLPEMFRCRVNSKGIVPPWVAGCVAHVLSRSEKSNDDHNVRVRLKIRSRGPWRSVVRRHRSTQAGSRESSWIARTRTANTRPRGARRASNGSAFASPSGVPGNLGKWRGNRRWVTRRSASQGPPSEETVRNWGAQKRPWVSSRHALKRRERLGREAQPETMQHVHQTAGTKRGTEVHPMPSSAKRAREISHPMFRILPQPDVC